ncbi:unnamed protein product [Fusarium graminearum]|nr:unnamed protein product [Fusarium graminearum]
MSTETLLCLLYQYDLWLLVSPILSSFETGQTELAKSSQPGNYFVLMINPDLTYRLGKDPDHSQPLNLTVITRNTFFHQLHDSFAQTPRIYTV